MSYMFCQHCRENFEHPAQAHAHVCPGPAITATVPIGPSLSYPQFAKGEHLAAARRRRVNYITYMRDRIEDEDWHGVSDAANDLRELDCEIRCLEAAVK